MKIIHIKAILQKSPEKSLLQMMLAQHITMLHLDIDKEANKTVMQFDVEEELSSELWQALREIAKSEHYEISISDNTYPKLPMIRMFLTDCDGCLTDGGMYYSENGDELKKFNARDGMAFARLKENGILTGIVTGESQSLNERRAKKLKLNFYEKGVKNKLPVVRRLADENNIPLSQVAYLGDDLNDLDVIRSVGFGCSVADGIDEVKKEARYVTKSSGGSGAVREVAELILASSSMRNERE